MLRDRPKRTCTWRKVDVTPPLNVKFFASVHIQGYGACYHGGAHSFSYDMLNKMVEATSLGPDIGWMFSRDDEKVLRERWLASAVSLKDGKWAIVGAKTDSVQIEGGKVRVKVFHRGGRRSDTHVLVVVNHQTTRAADYVFLFNLDVCFAGFARAKVAA